MKQILTLALVTFSWMLHAQQTAFIFQVGETSVNVADGSNGIFTSFELFPDDFENTDSLNAIEFIDFPEINHYNELREVRIKKIIV